MRVGELIELLKEQEENAEVYMEGCDCYTRPHNIRVDVNGDVYIEREEPG